MKLGIKQLDDVVRPMDLTAQGSRDIRSEGTADGFRQSLGAVHYEQATQCRIEAAFTNESKV